jgi:chromosome segregation protein
MVHIKRVELTGFKSFGGTIEIPLKTGFTVISGPNGSGKSNILDGLLFCLGLATSKGMRADRLPDLVNNSRKSKETTVSVTFELEEDSSEWTVTRRLKVSAGGGYSSTYFIEGQQCTVSELHEQLNRLRIYPEGYNVVLQGDVTRIITMNAKERRAVIDELAGVAEFDRRIEKTKETLEQVREREDRCRIIEQELVAQSQRLASDRLKAQKYQQLKLNLQQEQKIEKLLSYKLLEDKIGELHKSILNQQQQASQIESELTQSKQLIESQSANLEQLNQQIKALGEEEQLAVAASLATQNAQLQQIRNQQNQLSLQIESLSQRRQTLQALLLEAQNEQALLEPKQQQLQEELPALEQAFSQARDFLQTTREHAYKLSNISEAWLQEQSSITRKIAELQREIEPRLTQRAQLSERAEQLNKTLERDRNDLNLIQTDSIEKEQNLTELETTMTQTREQIATVAGQLSLNQQQQTLQQETQSRLLVEQREKLRQLDRLEATQQAQQEVQGTYATQLILQSDLPGLYGLVAQLGQVAPEYQLALEIAAGARLGQIVVEDDGIASAGIQLLKQKKAGRATFLPLNKINVPRLSDFSAFNKAAGFIKPAVELVSCQPKFRDVFLYVFGNTLVFENIETARAHLGRYRLVTLEGELLETSGAMTGGSQSNNRSGLRFGVVINRDLEEITNVKKRLTDIEQMLLHSEQKLLKKEQSVNETSQKLSELRQQEREDKLHWQQKQNEIQQLKLQQDRLQNQINQNQEEINSVNEILEKLSQEIPSLEKQLLQSQETLSTLEASQAHSEWQEVQKLIHIQENKLQQKTQEYQNAQNQAREYQNQQQKLTEKIIESQQQIQQSNETILELQEQTITLDIEQNTLEQKIKADQVQAGKLNEKLREKKQQRDQQENELKNLENDQQQKLWAKEKIENNINQAKNSLSELDLQYQQQRMELPNPLPEIDLANLNLAKIQQNIKQLQRQIEAMEPVNMLALQEYEQTQQRLEDLTERLNTIVEERTELLLRIENFQTLRQRAFYEAYHSVNENFQEIFAELSEGDGYLQLEDPDNPFNGGLNLVAHPKGKAVQRLSSMSGGEKSLTALSFIFALQRYRPSPFYAFDEVDMFLDGANVEKLSKMIKKQASQAQFIVVSLRRPMIEASQQTIGVTQARGAFTQVLGIKL